MRCAARLFLFTVSLAATGCAPALSTFQPAHVAPRGHLQVAAGFELGVSAGGVADAIDTGKAIAASQQNGRNLTEEDKAKLFDAGLSVALAPPISFGPHLSAALTVVDRLEVAARLAGSAWRLGARYQPLSRLDGPFDMSVGVGLSRYSVGIGLPDVIPLVKLEEFSRWQLDVPLLFGTSRDWVRVWGGPKLLLSSARSRIAIAPPDQQPSVASLSGTAIYGAGQVGVALGYRKLFVGIELTVARLFARGEFISTGAVNEARDFRVDGFVIYPSVGLLGEF